MLKFLDKGWKRWALAFLIIFAVGFIIGYLATTWVTYNGAWHGLYKRTFWSTLSPF